VLLLIFVICKKTIVQRDVSIAATKSSHLPTPSTSSYNKFRSLKIAAAEAERRREISSSHAQLVN